VSPCNRCRKFGLHNPFSLCGGRKHWLSHLAVGPVYLVDHVSHQNLLFHSAVEFLIFGVLSDLQVVSSEGLAHAKTNKPITCSLRGRRLLDVTFIYLLYTTKQRTLSQWISVTCSGREPFYLWRSHWLPASPHKLPSSPLWIGSCTSCTEHRQQFKWGLLSWILHILHCPVGSNFNIQVSSLLCGFCHLIICTEIKCVFLLVVTAVGWYRKWNARLKLMTLMLTSFNYWPNLPSVR